MAKPSDAQQIVRLRLICINPPPASEHFGLQDRDQNIHPGTAQADGSLRFECELRAKRGSGGMPQFTGTFAHGTSGDRFLYLTLRNSDGDIVRRIKVKLGSITWAQVEQAAATATALEASVDGRGAATVPLLGNGWQVV